MNWIELNQDTTIPTSYYTNRKKLLLKDVHGFIGVGYWDSYDWVLDNMYDDEHVTTFAKISMYCELD